MLYRVTITHTVDEARGERGVRTYGLSDRIICRTPLGPDQSRQPLCAAAPRQ